MKGLSGRASEVDAASVYGRLRGNSEGAECPVTGPTSTSSSSGVQVEAAGPHAAQSDRFSHQRHPDPETTEGKGREEEGLQGDGRDGMGRDGMERDWAGRDRAGSERIEGRKGREWRGVKA